MFHQVSSANSIP